MLKTAVIVVISFFAVVGIVETILCVLESFALIGQTQPSEVQLRVALSGEIDNVNFLLSTLLLQADRINFKNCVTKVVVVDYGLENSTYLKIKDFCDLNTNISMEKT